MESSTRQKRILWSIVLGTAALSALLLAYGITRLTAAAFLPLEPADIAGGIGAMRASGAINKPEKEKVDPDDILAHNIFDSSLGPLDGSAMALPMDGAMATFDPNAPPPDCGGLALVATVYVPSMPEASAAAIKEAGAALVYREGMSVGGKEVLEILANSVRMRSGSGLCQVTMFKTLGSMDSTAGIAGASDEVNSALDRVSALTGQSNEGIPTAEIEKNIEKVSETTYNVNRTLLNKLLENQSALMRSARIVPYKEGDQTVGVKLFGIRRNSLLKYLGLGNGDVLRTINGYDMTSPDSALQAYTRLRNESNLTVSILRGGSPVTYTYNVR